MTLGDDSAGIHERFVAALREFQRCDGFLLRNCASERALCHRLAVHLAETFDEYDVDCEYNLDGTGRKKLYRRSRARLCPVYPDIVVHRRGPGGPNLVAVEVKKGATGRVKASDGEKLSGYRSYYGYAEAVFVELPVGRQWERAAFIDWLAR